MLGNADCQRKVRMFSFTLKCLITFEKDLKKTERNEIKNFKLKRDLNSFGLVILQKGTEQLSYVIWCRSQSQFEVKATVSSLGLVG